MKTTAISKQEFDELTKWLKESNADLPLEIANNLQKLFAVYINLNLGATRSKQTLAELRRAMGILPKSEKGSQLNLSQEDLIHSSEEENATAIADLKAKRNHAWSQKLIYDKELKKLRAPIKNINQLEFTLERADEMMFSYPISNRKTEQNGLKVDRMSEFNKTTGLNVNFDYPKRVNLQVTVTEITYKVETVSDPQTGKTVRASTATEGPENCQITWETVSNLIKMHVGFAIPINRIALMIGQPEFSSSKICRVLKNAATDLLPVYLQLAEGLCDVKIISGDDTVTKILELENQSESALSLEVNKSFNWASPKANGTGDKKSLNVSLLVGQTELDIRSTIRFFRTHLGSVGNVLEKLLEWRNPKSGNLIFQGDLSSTNLPSIELQELFNMVIAGCGAHARRPFWKLKEQDEDFCYYMLRGFLMLSRIEKYIDAHGRTRENILYFRQRYASKIWIALKNRSTVAVTGKSPSIATLTKNPNPIQWPPSTDLYRAANYVINNFKELTVYLDIPELEFTNNGQERGLRIEKCMLNGSKFSKTKGGRVVLDVLRTINATCTAAQLDFTDYLRFVSAHKHLLLEDPKQLTPFAVSLVLKK